jgi:hypothetical protein
MEMAQKSVATVKKAAAPAKKTATAEKKSVSRQGVRKGDSLECEVCGFAVVVDEVCDCVEVHEILCCDQPMKPKAVKAKPKVKAAAKKVTAKAK